MNWDVPLAVAGVCAACALVAAWALATLGCRRPPAGDPG